MLGGVGCLISSSIAWRRESTMKGPPFSDDAKPYLVADHCTVGEEIQKNLRKPTGQM